MSADLLRRAAAKLRKHAEAATPGPWRVESSDNWDNTITYSVLGSADDHGVTPVPFRTTTEDAGYHSQAESDVDFAVLMHPPVALAVAELLDDLAYEAEDSRVDPELSDTSALDGLHRTALTLARAILREEEGILYRCDICEQGERREPARLGSDDDSARVAGWRIGASQAKARNVICPECAGTDEDYWDRRLLDVAYQSGMASFLLPTEES